MFLGCSNLGSRFQVRQFYATLKKLDLVRFVMCTLVSRVNMMFYTLIKGYTVTGNRLHMTNLTRSKNCCQRGFCCIFRWLSCHPKNCNSSNDLDLQNYPKLCQLLFQPKNGSLNKTKEILELQISKQAQLFSFINKSHIPLSICYFFSFLRANVSSNKEKIIR